MAVLGDSVMWGLGLREEEKASTRVQNWLSQGQGRRVHRRVYAHNGATVYPTNQPFSLVSGEVILSDPAILRQAQCVDNPEKVQLILVDGCANDVNPANVLNPTVDGGWLRTRINEICRLAVQELLEKIVMRFPKAYVVLTGYYPIMSGETSFFEGARLLQEFGLGEVSFVAFGALLPGMAQRSTIWADSMDQVLADVATVVNGRTKTEQYSNGRIAFAPAGFTQANAIGAWQSFLWSVPSLAFPGSVDDMYEPRSRDCLQHFTRFDDQTVCIKSAAGHPNPKGAATYAQAFITTLDHLANRVTSNGPALAMFQGQMHMVWKGARDDPGIYHAKSNDGITWTAQNRVAGVGTSDGPALAVFHGQLHMVWKGARDDPGIWHSQSNDGIKWLAQNRVAGVGTSNGPALAVRTPSSNIEELHMVWKGAGDDAGIYHSRSFDGGNWLTQNRVAGVGTSDGPALAVFQGQLHMVWKGARDDPGIWYSQSNDGIKWTDQNQLGFPK